MIRSKEIVNQGTPLIETKRLKLRELRPDDARGMHILFIDPKVLALTTFNPKFTSEEDARTYIQEKEKNKKKLGRRNYRFAVILKDTDEMIGMSKLTVNLFRRKAERAIFIMPKAWGKGYAPEGQSGVMEYAFKRHRIKEIFATCDPQNEKSKKAIMRTGLVQEKTKKGHKKLPDGTTRDSLYFKISRGGWEAYKQAHPETTEIKVNTR